MKFICQTAAKVRDSDTVQQGTGIPMLCISIHGKQSGAFGNLTHAPGKLLLKFQAGRFSLILRSEKCSGNDKHLFLYQIYSFAYGSILVEGREKINPLFLS